MEITIIEEYCKAEKKRKTSSKAINSSKLYGIDKESVLAFGERTLIVVPVKLHRGKLRSFIRLLVEDNYRIWAIMKTEQGNSHDEFWQDLYLIIRDGGSFSEILTETISEPDRSTGWFTKASVTYAEELSEELLNEWTILYSGEESERIIYAQKDNMLYRFDIIIS